MRKLFVKFVAWAIFLLIVTPIYWLGRGLVKVSDGIGDTFDLIGPEINKLIHRYLPDINP